MRPLVLALASCLLAGSTGCAPGDVATDPGDGFVVRSYTLDTGTSIWVEALVEDDEGLRRDVLAIDDGLALEDLIDELAMDRQYAIVLDSDERVVIVTVDDEACAWIFLG